MTPLRIGIAGIRSRGGLAYYLHRPEEQQRVVAAYDPDASVLAMARENYGAKFITSTNFEDLLQQDLDALLVTTPDWQHENQITQALEKGIAVLCHGAFALTIEGLDRVVATARENGVLLASFNSLRQAAYLQKMAELIQDDVIGAVKAVWCRHYLAFGGDIYFKDWPCESRQSLGLLLHCGYKDFDVLQWLAGAAPARVQAMGGLTVYGDLPRRAPHEKPNPRQDQGHWPPAAQFGFNPEMDVEDMSMVQLAMENGVLASYQQCHYAPDSWRCYTILGERGRLENRGNEPGFASVWGWTKRHDYYNPEGDLRIDIPKLAEGQTDGSQLLPEYRHMDRFVEDIRNGRLDSDDLMAQRNAMATAIIATHALRDADTAQPIPSFRASVMPSKNRTGDTLG